MNFMLIISCFYVNRFLRLERFNWYASPHGSLRGPFFAHFLVSHMVVRFHLFCHDETVVAANSFFHHRRSFRREHSSFLVVAKYHLHNEPIIFSFWENNEPKNNEPIIFSF